MSHTFVSPTRRQINLIVFALAVGMFLSALDQMVVATAIRVIGDDLHGLTLQAWVTTAYMVAATLSTPLYGKLSDIYGRKPLYVIALGLFVSGSMLCTTATSMYQLAAYRALQGAGAGGLMALAIMILGDLLSPRERTKYQAAFFAVWGVSSVLGPVIGGFFAGTDQFLGFAGWRWIFFINVPLGAAALFLIARVLHVPRIHHGRTRVDWSGVAALAVAVVPLLIVLERGYSWGWTAPLSVALFGVSLVGLVAFLTVERVEGDDALLPFRIFRYRTVGVATIVNFIMGFAMFGGMVGMPLYFQISRGMTPTVAGFAMLPATFGIMLAAMSSTIIIRKTGHYKWITVTGFAAMFAGMLMFTRLHWDSPFEHVVVAGAIFGLGMGCLMQPLMLAVQNALPPRDNGAGTASVMFSRQIGGSLGAAVFLSILFATVQAKINDAYQAAFQTAAFQTVVNDPAVLSTGLNGAFVGALSSPDPQVALAQAGITLDDTSFIHQLDPTIAAPFQDGFGQAIAGVMLIAAAVIVLGLVVIFFLPSIPLKEKSGVELMADEAAAAVGESGGRDEDPEPEPARLRARPPRS